MNKFPPIDIRKGHWEIIRSTLEKYVPQYEIWAFGSRAKWSAKEFSDLDIAIISDKPISIAILANLEEDFSESSLPFNVDIIDWSTIDESFKKIISEQKIGIMTALNNNRYPLKKLGDISINFNNLRKSAKSTEFSTGIYPYYGAQGIVDYIDKYIFDDEYILIAEDGENLHSLNKPIALWVKGKFWVNNHVHILQGKEFADSRFLFYAINSIDISGHITGSTIPRLSQKSLNDILVYTPPLEQQKTIAHILGTLDDKIECNRRMNETLEAMARAISAAYENIAADFYKKIRMNDEDTQTIMQLREALLPKLISGDLRINDAEKDVS